MQTIRTALPPDPRARFLVRAMVRFALLSILALGLGCAKTDSSTAAPTITSFSPATDASGTGSQVTVYGTGFDTATAVTICGVTVPSASSNADNQVVSDSELQFDLPAVTTTGPITVTGPGGTATSGESFIVVPTLTSGGITPLSGGAGTLVTLNGNGLLGVTGVAIGGVNAPITTATATAAKITVTVPAGLPTGTPLSIVLSNSYGLASITATSTFEATS